MVTGDRRPRDLRRQAQSAALASHTGASNATTGDCVSVLADLISSYHTNGLRWTKDSLTYYFDNQAIAQVTTPDDMHKPMYMIINLEQFRVRCVQLQ